MPPVTGWGSLGNEVYGRIDGFPDRLGFVLHMENVRLDVLECYIRGVADTGSIDFQVAIFMVYRENLY